MRDYFDHLFTVRRYYAYLVPILPAAADSVAELSAAVGLCRIVPEEARLVALAVQYMEGTVEVPAMNMVAEEDRDSRWIQ